MTDERSAYSDRASSEDELLMAALRTPPLSPEALERMHNAVEGEWRAAIAAAAASERDAPAARGRWFGLAAAAVVAAVGVTFWIARPRAQAVPLGAVTRTETGDLGVVSAQVSRRSLAPGDLLRVGDRLTARGPALIALAAGGTLRISAGSDLTVTSPSELTLGRGLIYLDLPPVAAAGRHLRVITHAGAVEHVGTEFEVMSDDESVRVRVREGRVRFIGRSNTVMADAGTELLAAPDRAIVQRPIDTFGRDWLWTAALAPDFEIEGRSLIGFLRWVSRELGRPLTFADANARQIADRTILHGSVRHQAPIDAISNVLATTTLTYEIRGDAIWVRSGTPAAL